MNCNVNLQQVQDLDQQLNLVLEQEQDLDDACLEQDDDDNNLLLFRVLKKM